MARSREEYLLAKREGMAQRRARDPNAARQKQKDWCDKNRQHVRDKVRNYNRRRFFWRISNRFRGENAATHIDIARLWRRQRGLCALTGARLTRDNAQIEHRVPKSRGGGDNIGNLQWATKVSNFCKRDMTEGEFLALCRAVVNILGGRII